MRAQVADRVHRVRPRAERQGEEHLEQAPELGRVGRGDGREAAGLEHRPRGPVAHLLGHLEHELVSALDQLVGLADGEPVRGHHRGDEVRRLAGHDEAGESLVHRQQDQRDLQVEIGRLVTVLEVAVERRREDPVRELRVAGPQPFHALAEAGVRLPHAEEILGDRVDIPTRNALAKPGREVRARHAAGGRVRAGQAGKIRMSLPGRVGEQIGDGRWRCGDRHASSGLRPTGSPGSGIGQQYFCQNCRPARGQCAAEHCWRTDEGDGSADNGR